jgi:hypothetical protein
LLPLHLQILNVIVSQLLRQVSATCGDRDRLARDPGGRLGARGDHRVRAGTRTGCRVGRTRSVCPLDGMSVLLRQTLTVFGLSPGVAYAVR